MIKYLVFLFILLLPVSAFGYVACNDVPVNKVETASSAGFHSLSDGSATGAVLFLRIPATYCAAYSGEELYSEVFLVIDDYDNAGSLKKYWASFLLTAKTTGKTIGFHAYYGGTNRWDASILEPYYL